MSFWQLVESCSSGWSLQCEYDGLDLLIHHLLIIQERHAESGLVGASAVSSPRLSLAEGSVAAGRISCFGVFQSSGSSRQKHSDASTVHGVERFSVHIQRTNRDPYLDDLAAQRGSGPSPLPEEFHHRLSSARVSERQILQTFSNKIFLQTGNVICRRTVIWMVHDRESTMSTLITFTRDEITWAINRSDDLLILWN